MENKIVMGVMAVIVAILMIGTVVTQTVSNSLETSTETPVISETIFGKNSWIITEDGMLFGSGINRYGEQGSGDTTNVTEFTQRLAGEKVKEVYSTYTGNETWVVTTDGKLFGCGRNNYGQQGSGTTDNVTEFTQRLAGEKVKKVITEGSTTFVLTTDGKLFGCGDNGRCQQGIDTDGENITEFTQRLAGEKVKEVVTNGSMTWVITDDGKLFGCGNNAYGEQGIPVDGNNVTSFTQRLSDQPIKEVVIDASVTWVVTTDGKLFGCGKNNWGQQGSGTSGSSANVTSFTQRLSDQNVAKVVTDGDRTYVVTTDGKLFGCGRNNYGQQGSGDTTNVTSFTQRLSDQTIANVQLSTGSTSTITTDGKLFSCGRNDYGQQGSGDTTNVTSFTQRLSDQTIANVQSDSGTTFVLTTDGKLFSCGANDNGQQGSGDTTNVTSFTQRLSDQSVKEYTTQSGSTWIVTTDGKLFSCGRNDVGQLGIGSTEQKVTQFTEYQLNDVEKVKDSPLNNVLEAIPLLMTIAVLVMAIGFFITKRE